MSNTDATEGSQEIPVSPGKRKAEDDESPSTNPEESRAAKQQLSETIPEAEDSKKEDGMHDPGSPEERRILIIGKTGNGKSSLANTITGDKHFPVGRGITTTTRKPEAVSVNVLGKRLKVVDTPDVSSMDSKCEAPRCEDPQCQVRLWKSQVSPTPHVILLAVRCDIRYTAEEHAIYRQLKHLWNNDAQFCQRLVVAFTFGDLQDEDLGEELNGVCPELKSVLQDAGNRYLLFDNKADPDTKDQQVRLLMDKMETLSSTDVTSASPKQATSLETPMETCDNPPAPAGDPKTTDDLDDTDSPEEFRVLIIGKTGNGKSSLANTIIRNRRFPIGRGMTTTTREPKAVSASSKGRKVKVVDTPDLNGTDLRCRDHKDQNHMDQGPKDQDPKCQDHKDQNHMDQGPKDQDPKDKDQDHMDQNPKDKDQDHKDQNPKDKDQDHKDQDHMDQNPKDQDHMDQNPKPKDLDHKDQDHKDQDHMDQDHKDKNPKDQDHMDQNPKPKDLDHKDQDHKDQDHMDQDHKDQDHMDQDHMDQDPMDQGPKDQDPKDKDQDHRDQEPKCQDHKDPNPKYKDQDHMDQGHMDPNPKYKDQDHMDQDHKDQDHMDQNPKDKDQDPKDQNHKDQCPECQVRLWKALVSPAPHAILLAVRCDIRYTAEEHAIYRQLKHLWNNDAQFCQRLVVAFTFGDRQDEDLGEELKGVCPELKSVLQDAGNRYLLFDNKADPDTKDQQVRLLMDKMETLSSTGSASTPQQNASFGRKQLSVRADHQSTTPKHDKGPDPEDMRRRGNRKDDKCLLM